MKARRIPGDRDTFLRDEIPSEMKRSAGHERKRLVSLHTTTQPLHEQIDVIPETCFVVPQVNSSPKNRVPGHRTDSNNPGVYRRKKEHLNKTKSSIILYRAVSWLP